MPTKHVTFSGTPVVVALPNPRRVVLALRNCGDLDSAMTSDYVRVSDSKGSLGGDEAWILAPGEVMILMKKDGDEPEKAWYARTMTGTGRLAVLESFPRYPY